MCERSTWVWLHQTSLQELGGVNECSVQESHDLKIFNMSTHPMPTCTYKFLDLSMCRSGQLPLCVYVCAYMCMCVSMCIVMYWRYSQVEDTQGIQWKSKLDLVTIFTHTLFHYLKFTIRDAPPPPPPSLLLPLPVY